MAMNQVVKNGESKVKAEMQEPLIKIVNIKDSDDEFQRKISKKESLAVVLLSTFVAVLGSYEFGSCAGYAAPVQSAIREDLDLLLAEFSLFGPVLTIGSMIGAITTWRIADFIGRKGAMRMSAVLSIAGWICINFSQRALLLDAGRFLTGYGLGVFSYVAPVYIAEIAPKDYWGGLAAMNQLMIVIGALTAFLVGTLVTWRNTSSNRNYPLSGSAPWPFSYPRVCQAMAGYQEEFDNALRRLRGDDTDISHEADEIQDYLNTLKYQPKATMLDLFQRRFLHPIIIGIGLMIFQQFRGANGIGIYASETFVSAGFPSGKVGIIAFACIQVPITTLGAFLMDNCGRKPLLPVSATGTFLGCFHAGTSFLMKDQNLLREWIPIFVLSGVLLYIGSFSIGMGAVRWVIMSEIFPINVKGAAGGLVNLVHWFGVWAVSYTFNFLMAWSPSGNFYLYSDFCAVAVLFVAKALPETKGRTLEEIQSSIIS